MPLIYTKDRDKIYETVTSRLFTQNNQEGTSDLEKLKEFSVTKSETSRNSKILSGTAIQNSTVKAGLLLNPTETIQNEKIEEEEPHCSTAPLAIIRETSENDEHKTIIEETHDKNSIISGSQKLQELKELHKQLRKSSIEPKKPLFEPRRPTLEAIKDAIDRAKKLETNRHKSVGTDDDESTSFFLSDASTSTESRKKKKKKKKEPNAKSKTTDSDSPSKKASRKPKKGKKVTRPK